MTVAGARLLSQRLAAPLTDPAAIGKRLDAVALFVGDGAARAEVRPQLAAAPDLARSLARLVLERGGPRDLAAIRDGLARRGNWRSASPRGDAGRDRRSGDRTRGAGDAVIAALRRRWPTISPI